MRVAIGFNRGPRHLYAPSGAISDYPHVVRLQDPSHSIGADEFCSFFSAHKTCDEMDAPLTGVLSHRDVSHKACISTALES